MNHPDPIKAYTFCDDSLGLQVRFTREPKDIDLNEKFQLGRYIPVMVVPLELWEELQVRLTAQSESIQSYQQDRKIFEDKYSMMQAQLDGSQKYNEELREMMKEKGL